MKNAFALALILYCFPLWASDGQYFVYYETAYVQGPWKYSPLVEQHDDRFLLPELYNDFTGYGDNEIFTLILSKLKERKLEAYGSVSFPKVADDTVKLSVNKVLEPPFIAIIRNEVVMSFTDIRGCNFVELEYFENNTLITELLVREDVQLPVFNVQRLTHLPVGDSLKQPLPAGDQQSSSKGTTTDGESSSRMNVLLIVSVILNIVALVYLFIMRAKK